MKVIRSLMELGTILTWSFKEYLWKEKRYRILLILFAMSVEVAYVYGRELNMINKISLGIMIFVSYVGIAALMGNIGEFLGIGKLKKMTHELFNGRIKKIEEIDAIVYEYVGKAGLTLENNKSISNENLLERKNKIYLPKREAELNNWRLRWRHIGGKWIQGYFKNYSDCMSYLEKYHNGLSCGEDTLRDNIRAGLAGKLDFPENP